MTASPQRAAASPAPASPAPDLAGIRAALRRRLPGIELAADLALAPIDNLFDAAASDLRFAAAPALYYANHQTSYESFLFSFLHLALSDAPLFVVTHPGLFDNDYGEHCSLLAEHLIRLGHPARGQLEVAAVPNQLAAARRFLLDLPDRLQGRSLLLHIEGWRELHEGQRIHLMSRDLMEVTVRLRRPVVPVRFRGGLPGQPAGHKFHLPYRMGRLCIAMGEPIAPETLAAVPRAQQRRRILDAINAMAPAEGVYAGRANASLARRCLRRHIEGGSSALKCFLMEALESMADPSPETLRLREFVRYGVLPTDGVADPEWFARKAMWLTDGRGLKTVAAGN